MVSSALETSVGIAAGLALAAALPELPYACGLATLQLLDGDVTAEPAARSSTARCPSRAPSRTVADAVAADDATTATVAEPGCATSRRG